MTNDIEELVEQVSKLPDPAARALAIDLVQAVMRLHAAAIERVLELAPADAATLAADEVVSRVLVLHGLHPDDFSTRLERALSKLQVYFDSHGAGIDVLEATPDCVRLRFTGNRPGAAAVARQLIEDAVLEAVPEVGTLTIEGTGTNEPGFVPLASLLATP